MLHNYGENKKPLWKCDSITVFHIMYCLINNSSNSNNCSVSRILRCNAGTGTLRSYNSSAAHIQRYMAAVTDNVTRLRFTVADASAAACLGGGTGGVVPVEGEELPEECC